MAVGEFEFDDKVLDNLRALGVDTSKLPTIDPGTVTKMPATTTTGAPGSAWWQDAGYPDAATAIQSGNFQYNMSTGWQLKPGATTPAMEKTAMGATTSPDLGNLGTSGVSMMEGEPTTLGSGESPMSPNITPESIMAYLGEAGPLVEGMDVNKDGEVSLLDSINLLQINEGLRNPDGTVNENYTKNETTTAVDKAVENASGGQGVATGYSGDGFEDQIDEQPPAKDIIEEIIESVSVNNTSESDTEAAIAAAVAAALGDGMTETAAKDTVEKELTKNYANPYDNLNLSGDFGLPTGSNPFGISSKEPPEKELEKADAANKAVEEAVGNGQPTTDDTILDIDDMPIGAMVVTPYYNPATGETFDQTNTAQPVPDGFIPVPEGGIPAKTETPAQPDFITQLQELIAQMQGEQTAAAEAAAAAEAERQKQAAEMTQNYMVGQPAVGYNPYQSGQYQNNPYGAAGVPDMGGITSIPVPAAYTPNPYLIGGTT